MASFQLPARLSRLKGDSREFVKIADRSMTELQMHVGSNAEEPEDLEARTQPLLSEDEVARRRRESVVCETSDKMHAQRALEHIITHEKDIIKLIDKSYEIIEENWLGDVDRMPGSIYSMAAFGLLFSKLHQDECSTKCQKAYIRCCGFIVIWLIQATAPPAILLSAVFCWGVPAGGEIKWDKWHVDFHDWRHIAFTKSLSLIFIEGFILNAIYVILNDRQTWRHIDSMFTYFQQKTPDIVLPGEWFLYLGALTNCWVVFWCCIDTVVVLGASQSPKDVVFDSLGLLFLFNLDDIGGDLGFVEEADWPGDRLGWIYKNMVPEDEIEFDCQSNSTLFVYKLTLSALYFMTIALPAFVAMTSFTELTPLD